MSQVTDDELNWGLIAWVIPLAGGVIGLIMRPNSNYVKHWSYLSLAFGLVLIATYIVLAVLSLVIATASIPLITATMSIPPSLVLIKVLDYLVGLVFFVVWVVGIARERGMVYWRPSLIYDVAKMLGAQ
jgi:predicted membrane channel-forming protein YqfA (hemolysin III family)